MSLSSLLAAGFVWLLSCDSQKGHPDFVVKAEKAAGSAQQSHQQVGAVKRRSDPAIPAKNKPPGLLVTPMYVSAQTGNQNHTKVAT